jgi:hypothetical protein
MRLWSLHPRYLDTRGLVALWREALLAQAVLRGNTRTYVNHPQVLRFREQAAPIACIAEYLRAVRAEALVRGYRFSAAKISRARTAVRLDVTSGQLEFERRHLLGKLSVRDPQRIRELARGRLPDAHPLFRVVAGGIATWEKGAGRPAG